MNPHNQSQQFAAEGRRTPFPLRLRLHYKGAAVLRRHIVMMRLVAILFLVPPSVVIAETELDFHLCSAFVQQSAVGVQSESGWPVHVKLTELGATNFEGFTEANIGRKSRVIVDGRVFIRATIGAPNLSGTLQGVFGSREIAEAWQQTLAGELAAAQCGVN